MKLTINEAREQANIHFRSQRLYADGYTLSNAPSKCGPDFKLIRSPKGEVYAIDTEVNTCQCPYFVKSEGKKTCKHLQGWQKLEADQNAHYDAMAKEYDEAKEADLYL